MITKFIKISKDLESKKQIKPMETRKNKFKFLVNPFYSNTDLVSEIQILHSCKSEFSKFQKKRRNEFDWDEEIISFSIQFFHLKMKPSELKQFFDDLCSETNDEEICSLASYIIALKVAQLRDPSKMFHKSKELIDYVINTYSKEEEEYVSAIQHFIHKQMKQINNNELKSYLPDANLEEFKKNEDYRRECILKISNTKSKSDYEYSVKLSMENGMSTFEPTLIYVKNLLKISNDSTEIQDEILLLCDEVLRLNPEKSLSEMEGRMECIDGYDVQDVLFYLDALYIISNNPRIQILKDVIHKLKEFKLNFLQLYSGNHEEILEEITKLLNDQNVEKFTESLVLLEFEKGMFYQILISKLISIGNLNKIEKYLTKIDETKWEPILKEISFGKSFKLPIKIEFFEKILKNTTDQSLGFSLKEILFKLKFTQRLFSNETLERTYPIFDSYFENKITIQDSLIKIIILTRDSEMLSSILSELKTIHCQIFGENDQSIPIISFKVSNTYELAIRFILEKIEL
jgi:hypothetical protein